MNSTPPPPRSARRHARRWAGPLTILLVLTACSAGVDATRSIDAPAAGKAALLGFTPAPLEWESCDDRLQCASLEVPVDHQHPKGPTITLALAMLPATEADARVGSLVTNPGGPGGSGVDFLGNDGPFNDEINRQFDIVSWDPRGVGRTQPLGCGEQLADTFLTVDLAPTDAAGHEALERAARDDARACEEINGTLLDDVGMADAVLDLEAIRLALGGDPITYVGFSYGTVLGLRYAEQFPGNLRAMALDGIVNPEQTLADELETTALSIDASLLAALTACDVRCPIKGDPVDAYRDLVEAVRHEPLRTGDGRDVAANAVVLAGIAVTYDDELRPLFHAAIAEGQRGAGGLFVQFAEGFVGEFDLAPTLAVYCGDLPHPTSAHDVEALATGAARRASVVPGLVSGYIRAFALTCLDWPTPAPDTLEPVTAAGSPPILVVGNTGDPVTPYAAAEAVAGSLDHGRLLTYNGTGHLTYGKNICADTHIDAYVVDLALPPTGSTC